MSVDTFINRIRNITRQDPGINGDAQRIEQMSWLLFLKIYDSKDKIWEMEDDSYKSIIPDNLKWSNWGSGSNSITGDELLNFVNNELLKTLKEIKINPDMPFRKQIVKSAFEDISNYMKDGTLLRQVINVIDELNFDNIKEIHLFNDIYETILKKIQEGGSGEFYTPRALTDFIAEILDPKLGQTMADLACGTGGFLTSFLNRVNEQKNTLEDIKKYSQSVYGIEKKGFPYLLAVINLFLHNVDDPNLLHGNSLEKNVKDYSEDEKFDLIMMNPPFGGSEQKIIQSNFPKDLRSAETADLFMLVIMHRLKMGGKAAVILPDGFLFGTGAQKNIKKKLFSEFNVHTIIRLPKTVFSPYTDINTNIIFFDNNGSTKSTWFYRLDMPENQKNFSKTKPMVSKHLDPIRQWWNNRNEIIEDTFYKSKQFSISEIEELDYNLNQCGYLEQSEEVLEPMELIKQYYDRRTELNNKIDNVISEIIKILEKK
ncbi:SAM-dependent DNA methyltransferase [Mycoplasma bovis]|uniref:site-specific DNA-methyltransferase (adenine-specific) n=3 Tax=Mycoplasmopsis bovis TaxID=28903 RepID=A0A454APQ2_MYCBG|nr:class I SAM-dependent DNA methyltransferase [Mycoplasmopsis bovis]ADR24873.1 type I restriction-modification system, M subunit [Mycoplasmopsis bovis PG45]AXJ74310.1 SAM-dependent DNA methyltransferase [Mycoplasmopsis bovis]MBT1368811.1 SAM-dependent DNA methyltransferase [Mycoplasmopsis bovis]QRF85655.1 SAM-dependent DNA methyltransferase [Mycoplasmopsis bovis]